MPRETVAEESDPGGGTYRLELVRCGKAACSSCPHGPYWYRYYRTGGRLVSKYVGKDRAGAATTSRGSSATDAPGGPTQATAAATDDPASPAPVRHRLTARRRDALERAAAHPRGGIPTAGLSARDEEALKRLGYAASIDDCGHVNSDPEETAHGEHRSHPHFFRLTAAGRAAVERRPADTM